MLCQACAEVGFGRCGEDGGLKAEGQQVLPLVETQLPRQAPGFADFQYRHSEEFVHHDEGCRAFGRLVVEVAQAQIRLLLDTLAQAALHQAPYQQREQ